LVQFRWFYTRIKKIFHKIKAAEPALNILKAHPKIAAMKSTLKSEALGHETPQNGVAVTAKRMVEKKWK
jgi:hypothetical protein